MYLKPGHSACRNTQSILSALPIIGILLLSGCELPGARTTATGDDPGAHPAGKKSPQSSGPTQSDKLLKFYPDLSDGPFAVIADFEDPVQMEIVDVRGAETARISRNPAKGRKQTGKGCLEFNSTATSDELILGNGSATNWHLRRNWRPYDLLLASIFVPVDNLQLVLTLAAGSAEDRDELVTRRPLNKGWNQLRLDLAEVGDRLALDDLREMRISIAGSAKPVSIFLDDLILSANRTDLFGDSASTNGELFVRKSGRRWHVGAGGRFELTFANGQIAAWHDLAHDPYRLRNLTRGTALGPTLVTVDAEFGRLTGTHESSSSVEASIRIMEMNAIRAVVTCNWRPAATAPNSTGYADQHITYTVYASGHVFVELQADRLPDNPDIAHALAVGLFTAEPDHLTAHTAIDLASSDSPYGHFRASADSAMLFAAVDESSNPMTITADYDASRQRGVLLARSRAPMPGANKWWAHFLFLSGKTLTSETQQQWANEFALPAAPVMEIGEVSDDDKWHNSFDRTNGCFQLRPEAEQLRWTLGRNDSMTTPSIYCLDAIKNVPAWVYVNHLIHQPVITTHSGQLIFQLPAPATQPLLIEVLWQKQLTTPAPTRNKFK